jgi:Pyridoxamine 5'-phosphate oxidase
MAERFSSLRPDLAQWWREQPMFFVATAPSGDDGHVNVSPKGLAGIAILGPHRCAYLDLTGSGVETIAHIRENGRVTVMFCAFEGPPRICRLQGHGTVHLLGSSEYAARVEHFPDVPGARAIIDIDVTRISTSCGFGVPLMQPVGARDDLIKWAARKGDDGLADYRATRNARSIDGLPAYPASQAADRG